LQRIATALGLLVLVALIASYYVYTWLEAEAFTPSPPNEYVIPFEEVGETIYIRARGWGLAGNHQEIIVSNSPIVEVEPDKEHQVVYLDNTELYFKKVGSDTLEIHAGMLSELPKGFSSNVRINQIKLDPLQARTYAEHYKEYGLSKASIYPVDMSLPEPRP
jgi:hypothetical protein